MKLCSLTQSYAPTGGGVRTLLHAQREYCRARDIPHVMIVPGARDEVLRDGVLTTCTIASPLLPGSRVYRLLLRSDKVLRLLREHAPDVIELHCAYNLPWTAFAHRRRHGGIVSGIYNTDVPVAYVEPPLRRAFGDAVASLGRSVAESYVRALYNRCDVVVAISPAMRRRLQEMGVRGPQHVPLGVDVQTFAPARRSDAVRARFGATDDTLLLVYAGRLDHEKRPDLLVEMMSHLPPAFDATLVLVGDGPLREELGRRGERVHVLPFMEDRAELAQLLASGDVYVSAMAHETFGLSVIEAQASGLPVVGFAAGAMTDRVQPGEGFLVDTNDTFAMAEVLRSTPRAQWRSMGMRAHERVRQQFSWDRSFDALLEIYRARPS